MIAGESSLDLDTVIQNDQGRKLFSMYLKELNNSCDNLLTLYLICCCFQNHQRIEDRQRIKQILEKTYNACFIKNELTHLSTDLKQKLGESLQRKTYNESIFNAVKSELKMLLETEYFPQFLHSTFFKENSSLLSSLLNKPHGLLPQERHGDKQSDKHSISLLSLNDEKKSMKKSSVNKGLFAMPNVPKNKAVSSNRMLKQSKSSSSSTSSVASVTSTTKQSKLVNNNKSISKSSLSNEPKLTKSSHYKSNTSINSLNFPPNPYHVSTKAIPVSAQDSERQSVISADESNLKSVSRMPKLNRQIKENLLANKDAKLNMPEFNAEASSQPLKKPIDGKCPMPLAESNPKEFFHILSTKLESYLTEKHHSSLSASFTSSRPKQHRADKPDLNSTENYDLPMSYESEIDAQLDEHLDRVYSTAEASSKMSFVKVSSLSRARNDRSLNLSCHSNSQRGPDTSSNKHHHFYKLTSTSKEVDIDDTHHNSAALKADFSFNEIQSKKSGSLKNKNQKAPHPLDSCDSGVSVRSAASIERVNDWLSSSINQPPEEVKKSEKNSDTKKPVQTIMAPPEPKKETSDVKTTVAYYLPGEDLAYISTFNGEFLTLAQFKQLITKKGHFRYFFKTKSDLLDEECVVYQEATDESSNVPMFNNKVIAKIEKCNSSNNS